ncbi:MAG: hypothetical protein PHT25_00045 [Bacteroidales bacterium]|nr:hypothetical protein [Bacteroidales bacterium]
MKEFKKHDSLGKADKVMSVIFLSGTLLFGLSALVRIFFIEDHNFPLIMIILQIVSTFFLLISAGWCLGRWVNPYGILMKK